MYKMLQTAKGERKVGRALVFKWHKLFPEGRLASTTVEGTHIWQFATTSRETNKIIRVYSTAWFSDVIKRQWPERHQRCVFHFGAYFEKSETWLYVIDRGRHKLERELRHVVVAPRWHI